mgnify:CR=1 FL=1
MSAVDGPLKCFSFPVSDDPRKPSHYVQDFVEFPFLLYKNNDFWIPPIKVGQYFELSMANAFFTHGRGQLFLCKRNGKTVGRASASVDDLLSSKNIGHFGYFDCVDDLEVATLLLEEVVRWLEAQNRSRIEGPMNFNIYNSYRIQTKGFETTPFMGEVRNHSYYEKLITNLGLKPVRVWKSYEMGQEEMKDLNSKVTGMFQKKQLNFPDEKFYHDPADFENFEKEMAILRPICLDIFSDNYSYTEIGDLEYIQSYGSMKKFMTPEQFLKCRNKSGLMIGVAYYYWDFHKSLQKAWGDLQALERTPFLQPENFVFHTIGARKDYLSKGVFQYLLNQVYSEMLKNPFKKAIMALCVEELQFFRDYQNGLRTYTLFGKDI